MSLENNRIVVNFIGNNRFYTMSIKKLFIFCVATVLTVFMPVRTAAAPLEFIFDHYSTDDGLPHNYISDIHQDSKGFIWLSTWYGLSRYDGNSFVNYTMQPGDFTNLSHNRILSAREDVKGHLWVTCYDNRLYRFDPETEVFVAVPENLDAFSDISAEVNVFHCAGDGCTWIGLDGVGLCKVSEDLRLTSYVHLTHTTIGRQISAIYEDSEGTIYVVSELGLTAIRGDEVNMLSRRSDVLAFAQNGTTLFFADKEGISLIDMLTGDRHRVTASSYGLGRITALAVSGSVPYVGFRNSAVARIDMTDYTLKPLKGDFGRVRYLFPDSAGMLWIATERTGIYSYSPETDRFRHYEHSRNVMSYYADTLARVVEKDGRLFIKMNNYGFGYYDRDNDEIVPLHNVKEQQDCRFMNGVACYEVDKSGVLWMSTIERGLERVTVLPSKVDIIEPPTKFDEEVSSSEIRAMLRDSRGHVWVAGKSSELYRYDEEMKHCRRFPDGRSGELGNIYSIFEDRDGNIWLGTKGTGIVRMTPKGNDYEYRRYRHRTDIRGSVSSDNIYSIAQDGDGRLWFGTFGGGISMLENAGSGYFHNVYEDFPNYPIAGGEKVRYLHYTSDGKMLAATVGGLLIFDPSESPENMRFLCTRKVPGDMHSLGNNDIIYMFTDSADRTWLCTFGGASTDCTSRTGHPVSM